MKNIKYFKIKQRKINGMPLDRLREIWDSNVDGAVYSLVDSVMDKISDSNPKIIMQTNGFLQIAIFEVAQELVSIHGVIWGKIWRDVGFGTLIKEGGDWIINFDEEDERFLTQSVIDKYTKENK